MATGRQCLTGRAPDLQQNAVSLPRGAVSLSQQAFPLSLSAQSPSHAESDSASDLLLQFSSVLQPNRFHKGDIEDDNAAQTKTTSSYL